MTRFKCHKCNEIFNINIEPEEWYANCTCLQSTASGSTGQIVLCINCDIITDSDIIYGINGYPANGHKGDK